MRLESFCELLVSLDFPRAGEDVHPTRDTVRQVREGVREALYDQSFLVDCIELDLALIERGRFRSGLTPFHVVPELGIDMALGHWSPGATPGAHEHTAWTVTGVCSNRLDVLTFDYAASQKKGKLVPGTTHRATRGDVGFIHAPCFHAPVNRSDRWSLTLHLTSPLDGAPTHHDQPRISGLATGPRPTLALHAGYEAVVLARQNRRLSAHLGSVLSRLNHEDRIASLIQRCSAISGPAWRRHLSRVSGEQPVGPQSNVRLQRVHPDLELTVHVPGSGVELIASTGSGDRVELATSHLAREAMVTASTQDSFFVRDLPGPLTSSERAALGEALEETGLFKRVAAV